MVDSDPSRTLIQRVKSAPYKHLVNIDSVVSYMLQPGRPHKEMLVSDTLKCIPISITFWALLTLVTPGKPFNTHKVFRTVFLGSLFGLLNSFRYTGRKVDLWTVQSLP